MAGSLSPFARRVVTRLRLRISETELRALSSAGGLVKSITRETLAMYLVRAMQLAPLAQSLTSYPMSFADTTSISASLQPYVYLLNM